jgi:AraC family transcriptional regulator, arabinose operon regulatory protein
MDPRIAAVIERMRDELHAPLGIAELASAVNLSPSRLIHLFRAEIGVPPARYLRDLRLRRARASLQRTFLSVKEIMVQVGFSDPSHFSRAFKLRYGVSPRDFRSRARGAPGRAGRRPREPGPQQKAPTVSRIGPQSAGAAAGSDSLQ